MHEERHFTKPSLVFLHGWGLNRAIWPQALRQALADWDVRYLDLPGFGERTAVDAPEQLSAWTDALLQDIPRGSIVIGWSLGGMLAIDLADRYPERVRALGLIASSPCFLGHDDWPGMKASVMNQFASALKADTALTIDRFLAIQAMGSITARHDVKLLREAVASLPAPSLAALQGGLRILHAVDLRQRLPLLSQPVFGCFGRLDTLVPVAMLEPLQHLCPQGSFHVVAKASHAPFVSHPDEFSSWLLSELSTLCKE